MNNTNALISPHDFGGLTGVIGIPVDNPSIHPIWLAMVQMLQGQGYSVGRNLFGAPYDWRVSFYTLSRVRTVTVMLLFPNLLKLRMGIKMKSQGSK